MSSQPLASQWPGRAAVVFACLLLLTGTTLRFFIALNRGYQVDEVEHIHATYEINTGKTLYRDFWEGHTPLLYLILRPLVRASNPPASFTAGRMLSFLLSIAIVYFTYKVARRIFGAAVAVAAAVLLTFYTTFAERSIEIRPDPWMAFFMLAALWLEIREDHQRKHSVYGALLLGCSFLFTQKSIFSCLIVGSIWMLRAFKQKDPREFLLPLLSLVTPILLSFLYFWHVGALREYVQLCFVAPGGSVSRTGVAGVSTFSPFAFFSNEAARNKMFLILSGAGIGYSSWRIVTSRAPSWLPGGLNFPLLAFLYATLVQCLSLWINPFPFPYFHVTVLPSLAIASAVGMMALIETLFRSTWSRLTGGLVLCIFVMQGALPRIYSKTADRKSYQLLMLNEIQKITQPDDSVVDLVGLYFRPDGVWTFVMTGVGIERYSRGYGPRLIPQMIERKTVAVMSNYRMAALPPKEFEFIRTHFVHYKGNIFVQGCHLVGVPENAALEFQVLKGKNFRLIGAKNSLRIDGKLFESGFLTDGVHELRAVRPIDQAILIMDPPGAPHPDLPPNPGLYINFD